MRRALAALALLALLLAPLAAADAEARQQRRPRPEPTVPGTPNVVLILTDDQPASTLAHMPFTKSLLQDQGTTFPNAFVSQPVCCPSRASLLLGRYPHNTGILRNDGRAGGYRGYKARGYPAADLSAALDPTYQTGLYGKYLNGYGDGLKLDDAGKRYWAGPRWDQWVALTDVDYRDVPVVANGTVRAVTGRRSADHVSRYLNDLAVRFVKASPSPFFLYLPVRAPHAPATPLEADKKKLRGLVAPRTPAYQEADRSDKPAWVRAQSLTARERQAVDSFYRQQALSLQEVDRGVARIVDALTAAGRLDDTYIIFASDNGHFAGEHGIACCKGMPYDAATRVPLVVRGPGVKG